MIIEVERISGGTFPWECEQVDATPFGICDIGDGEWGALHIPAKRKLADVEWQSKDQAIAGLRRLWAELTPSQRAQLEGTNRPSAALQVFVSQTLQRSAPPKPAPQPQQASQGQVVERLCRAVEITAMLLALPHYAALREVFRGRLERAIALIGPKPNQATEVADHVQQG